MAKKSKTQQSVEIRVSDVDPFPEPGDFPANWNMDSILNPAPAKKRGSQPLPDWHESFAEVRTFPKNWSV